MYGNDVVAIEDGLVIDAVVSSIARTADGEDARQAEGIGCRAIIVTAAMGSPDTMTTVNDDKCARASYETQQCQTRPILGRGFVIVNFIVMRDFPPSQKSSCLRGNDRVVFNQIHAAMRSAGYDPS